MVIRAQFESGYPFSEGLARVSTGDKFGFIDKTGRMVLPEQYGVLSGDFSEGLAGVCVQSGCGYIDQKGTMIIPAQYRITEPFRQGLAEVHTTRAIGYIDHQGKYVWQPTQ